MYRFEAKVLNYIQKNELLEASDKVLVGFSGGADSLALLSVLEELHRVLGISLLAVHVNHGIRPEAGEDEAFCREFCEKLEISFFSVKEDVPALAKSLKLTEEEAGRKVRYDTFDRIAKEQNANRIAIAHHQNDAAETLLMNLFRGSGMRGAAAIRAKRENIIRPLLCVTRKEIEDYLSEKELSFCVDATNEENIHTRNIIRNKILPVAESEVNNKAVEHLASTAVMLEKAENYVRKVAQEVFDEVSRTEKDKVTLDVNRLLLYEEIIREYVVLLSFERLVRARKDITHAHVEAVLSLMNTTVGSSYADLPYSLVAKRNYGELTIEKKKEVSAENVAIPVRARMGETTEFSVPGLGCVTARVFPKENETDFPTDRYTKWFDYGRIQEVVFRTRDSQDYICIEQGGGICKKALNKLMTDEKIPKDVRDDIYILAKGSEVLWVPGVRMSGAFKVDPETKEILEISIKK
ncbi:MAG: tRNA lysidine(34) synthetase TilS [Butyrivibrio sp.]|nr:tRNA lysidine(34) synthetase TilS [Butyrivibrio sp.]